MHKFSLASFAAMAFVAMSALLPGRAQALPLTAGAGSLGTVTSSAVEQVRYVCHRNWRGRRVCSWRPNYYRYGYGPSFGFAAPGVGVYVGPRRYYYGRRCGWRYGRRVCW
jgi:hypothetical protein